MTSGLGSPVTSHRMITVSPSIASLDLGFFTNIGSLEYLRNTQQSKSQIDSNLHHKPLRYFWSDDCRQSPIVLVSQTVDLLHNNLCRSATLSHFISSRACINSSIASGNISQSQLNPAIVVQSHHGPPRRPELHSVPVPGYTHTGVRFNARRYPQLLALSHRILRLEAAEEVWRDVSTYTLVHDQRAPATYRTAGVAGRGRIIASV